MDPESFLKLFDEHHLPLFRFAYRMTGSAADAADVVQECFLQLLRPGCTYDPKRAPIRTWLFGVVRNQSLKRRSKEGPPADSVQSTTPESLALRTELEQVVARAVAELPEGQPEVLILAHYEQMSLAEIAGVMDIEVTAVKSRLQRARAQMKENLATYVVSPERKR